MHLTLTPQMGLPGQPETTIQVAGETVIIDGRRFDLSAIPEDDQGWPEAETPFIAPVMRRDGVIHATIIVRLDDTASGDQPDDPWIIPDASGDVVIPAARKPVDEIAE